MMSVRHISDRAGDRPDPRDGYLDAAHACILDVGWRRTTLTEVARRAGVSRMTIYRTWSDMQTLLGDLMTREWTAIAAARPPGDGPTGLVGMMIATVQALRDNELFVRIVELDPELLLPYLLSRRGRSQEFVLDLLAARIEQCQARGEIRAGDPLAIARALVLGAHGFVLSSHTMVDDRVSEVTLDAELAELVSRALAP